MPCSHGNCLTYLIVIRTSLARPSSRSNASVNLNSLPNQPYMSFEIPDLLHPDGVITIDAVESSDVSRRCYQPSDPTGNEGVNTDAYSTTMGGRVLRL